MEIWWDAGSWSNPTIRPVRVVAQTSTTVTTDEPGGGTVKKRSEFSNYFATFNEAVTFAKEKCEKTVLNAKKRISAAYLVLAKLETADPATLEAGAKEIWVQWDNAKNAPLSL